MSELGVFFLWFYFEHNSKHYKKFQKMALQGAVGAWETGLPTSCPVFRYYSSSIAILKIYALRVTEISPGVAIHKICCVSSEIFNFKVPQVPRDAVLSDKSCFSYFLNFSQFLHALVFRIEFLELFSCWGMAWN